MLIIGHLFANFKARLQLVWPLITQFEICFGWKTQPSGQTTSTLTGLQTRFALVRTALKRVSVLPINPAPKFGEWMEQIDARKLKAEGRDTLRKMLIRMRSHWG